MLRWLFGRKAPDPLTPALIETPPVDVRPVPDVLPVLEPPGAQWCERYPGSRSLDDLVEPFRASAKAFVEHLEQIGCRVEIASTLRPEPRAWLMRGCWDVVYLGLENAPKPRADIPIDWQAGGDRQRAYAGALAMLRTYGLRYQPSLTSRHIQGLAADLSIEGWLGTPEALYALGAEYGVHHLPGDPVHWSVDGH